MASLLSKKVDIWLEVLFLRILVVLFHQLVQAANSVGSHRDGLESVFFLLEDRLFLLKICIRRPRSFNLSSKMILLCPRVFDCVQKVSFSAFGVLEFLSVLLRVECLEIVDGFVVCTASVGPLFFRFMEVIRQSLVGQSLLRFG